MDGLLKEFFTKQNHCGFQILPPWSIHKIMNVRENYLKTKILLVLHPICQSDINTLTIQTISKLLLMLLKKVLYHSFDLCVTLTEYIHFHVSTCVLTIDPAFGNPI